MECVLDWILTLMWAAIAFVGFMGVGKGFGTCCAIFWYFILVIAFIWTLSKIK